jgi:hypothetical protein
MCDHEASSSSDLLIRLEKLLIELGWPVPKDTLKCCRACLESMISDLSGELSAIQSRELHGSFTVVDETSEAYHMAVERFHETRANKVVRVEQVNNPKLMDEFTSATASVSGEWKWLFHGSNNQNYISIAKGGFDMSRSKNGALGYGVYFAQNASYSYGYTNALSCNGTIYGNILLCKVLITGADRDMKGTGADIYCITNDRRAYPYYIIYYEAGSGLAL